MSNQHYNLRLKCTATYNNHSIDFEFDPYNDCSDMDGLAELALLEMEANNEIIPDVGEIDANDISVKITGFGEVPADYANEHDVWEFAKAFAECRQPIEVVEAALDCGVSSKDIDDAFEGEFDSDEDFAKYIAEEHGTLDNNSQWPANCIDWEWAARELMYDYCESNGYYFKNL